MLRDITLGQYYPADSVIHKLDPRVKLFSTMIYIISLFCFRGVAALAIATVFLTLTLFVWICVGIVYVSGLVLGLISMVIALLGVAVLLTCSLQNGIILLVMAFLISPYGLPMAAIWLLGKVQDLKFAIQDLVYG